MNCVSEKGIIFYGNEYDEEFDEEDVGENGEDNDSEALDVADPSLEKSCMKWLIFTLIALRSPENASEVFYTCKVLDVNVAEKDIVDSLNHHVFKGSKYFKCNYLEKIGEKRGFVNYKMVKGEVCVLCPFVDITEESFLLTISFFM